MSAPEDWLPLKPKWFHILLSLADAPRHGYAIRKDVEERSSGQVRLWPTALYGSIAALAEGGLIRETGAASDDPRRIEYELTALGRRVLGAETRRLAELVRLSQARNPAPSTRRS